MKLACLWGWLILVAPLIAQGQARVEVAPAMYCARVEQFSVSHPPLILAQIDGAKWAEFPTAEEWRRAGGPMPLALAWQKDGSVVRIAIALEKNTGDYQQYSDYCYRPDGTLAMSRPMPQKEVACDSSHMRCEVTLRGQQFYRRNGEPWKTSSNEQQVQAAEMTEALRSWKFRPESATVSFDSRAPQVYPKVSDLPFERLLAAKP